MTTLVPLEYVIESGELVLDIYRPSTTHITVQPVSAPGAGPQGPQGEPGNTFHTIVSTGVLDPEFGADGDYAVLVGASTVDIYGPKTAGVWSLTPVTLESPERPPGVLSISSESELVAGFGIDGDYAIDIGASGFVIYGPKASGAWPLPGVTVTTPDISGAITEQDLFQFGIGG